MRVQLSLALLWGLTGALAQNSSQYWYETISHQGLAPYAPLNSSYKVFRNVVDFGAKGDGIADDTAAIQQAMTANSSCLNGICPAGTTTPAVVYFPAGTYLISSSIFPSYMTQIIGNPNDMPVLKAVATFNDSHLIDGDFIPPTGEEYKPTDIFYRQIRNLILDLTEIPDRHSINGIHWPTGQSTSIQNCVFNLPQSDATEVTGLYIENGSGGLLSDLVFNGGLYGMNVGSQQFTSRNLTFSHSQTAIYQLWDWGWTYIGLSINHCGTGLDMSKGGPNAQAVGSVIIVDSSIANTTTGILTAYVFQNKFNATDLTGGSLALENVNITQVGTAVQGVNGASLVGTNSSSPSFTIDAWVEGNTYNPTGPNDAMGDATAFTRPQTLQGNSSSYFTWSKPQYEHLNASAFLSARTAGCKGDGVTDDTAAITAAIALAQSNGKILFFDAGIYVVTSTIVFTPGLKVIGESYPVILGSGSSFSDVSNPLPVVQVGNSNATQGIVQWSDMVVSTQGNTAGAILIQWNLLSDSNSPSGMWDIHTRIGGFKGSKLQADDCPISPANPDCAAAFASMQITTSAGGLYMENIWLWTADHDLDDPSQSSVTVLTGRGLSVEAEAGNIWLIATAVEHHSLYQYNFANTANVFGGFLQSSTPYYQPGIPAGSAPYVYDNINAVNDPDFNVSCSGQPANCYDAWGLRVIYSNNINIYGAGLYSFYNSYDQTCSTHNTTTYNSTCQTAIFGIDSGGPLVGSPSVGDGSNVNVYGLNTLGSASMINSQDVSIAGWQENANSFAQSIIQFMPKNGTSSTTSKTFLSSSYRKMRNVKGKRALEDTVGKRRSAKFGR